MTTSTPAERKLTRAHAMYLGEDAAGPAYSATVAGERRITLISIPFWPSILIAPPA